MWQETAGARGCRNNAREEAANERRCGCGERPRPRPEPVRGIEDILDDILESVNNIEECTCERIVRLLKKILDALEEDNHHDHC
ncbi:MAG: hypothetical protein H7X94_04920 [Vallitaleaceae bacterium]|nr:hypothetical protein [Vallitaleaceae bacterium]